MCCFLSFFLSLIILTTPGDTLSILVLRIHLIHSDWPLLSDFNLLRRTAVFVESLAAEHERGHNSHQPEYQAKHEHGNVAHIRRRVIVTVMLIVLLLLEGQVEQAEHYVARKADDEYNGGDQHVAAEIGLTIVRSYTNGAATAAAGLIRSLGRGGHRRLVAPPAPADAHEPEREHDERNREQDVNNIDGGRQIRVLEYVEEGKVA